MYAKVFRQIYDSTLAEDWRALVTFQQFLVLADADGVVDMTAGAIHRTTNIPKDIIEAGIEKLQQPDPVSRSSTEEGRRIVPIDPDRSWGWRIVNYSYYRNLASKEDKKEKDRERMAEKRKQISGVADSREPSPIVEKVAHTEAEAKAEAKAKKQKARTRATTPDEFVLTENLRQWGKENGLNENTLRKETEKFLDHHRSKGNAFKDWDGAWRNWMRKAMEWSAPQKAPPSKEFPRQ